MSGVGVSFFPKSCLLGVYVDVLCLLLLIRSLGVVGVVRQAWTASRSIGHGNTGVVLFTHQYLLAYDNIFLTDSAPSCLRQREIGHEWNVYAPRLGMKVLSGQFIGNSSSSVSVPHGYRNWSLEPRRSAKAWRAERSVPV
jgi:hypothetical protein